MTTTFFPISSVCLLSGGDANHEKKGENIEGSQYLCSFLNPSLGASSLSATPINLGQHTKTI